MDWISAYVQHANARIKIPTAIGNTISIPSRFPAKTYSVTPKLKIRSVGFRIVLRRF